MTWVLVGPIDKPPSEHGISSPTRSLTFLPSGPIPLRDSSRIANLPVEGTEKLLGDTEPVPDETIGTVWNLTRRSGVLKDEWSVTLTSSRSFLTSRRLSSQTNLTGVQTDLSSSGGPNVKGITAFRLRLVLCLE